jgi:hypothetical protein
MVPPIAGLGPTTTSAEGVERFPWLTADRLTRVRAILLGLSLFLGLAVYIFHTLGVARAPEAQFVQRLRGLGYLTWVYALVQMIDMRFYNSRFAQRRRVSMGIPDSLHGWLFGQMLAWFGILYYVFTEDVRWYAAGLVIFVVSFAVFPITTGRTQR